MDNQLKEAIALAAEISKQLMTLSTGIIAVTITVVARFARRISVGQLWILLPAWLCYLFTILFSLWHLSALTGNTLARPIDNTLGSATLPAILQLFTFGLGTFLVVVFATWFCVLAVVEQLRAKFQART